jgi:hypothetical protein
MATVVFIHRLQPADGKRDALIGLLREFADSINADPECLHYSVHEPIDDEATPLTCGCRKPAPPGQMLRRTPSAQSRVRCLASQPGQSGRAMILGLWA